MSKKYRPLLLILLAIGAIVLVTLVIRALHPAVLYPQGLIAHKQRNLIVFGSLLSLVVLLPVFAMTFMFSWKYRETNTTAKYSPDQDHSRVLEAIWWLVPLTLITILSVVTWRSSHELDPFRSLSSTNRPITIQVVALDWKWLFIYPNESVASVNFVEFPAQTPIDFEITADAPMNSFWIPALGGQIYAMSGMTTHLHLMADGAGDYNGLSANISGDGFAGMKFIARSTSGNDYQNWLQSLKQTPNYLTFDEYTRLAKPSQNNPVISYASVEENLYNKVIAKFMPVHSQSEGH